MPDRWTRFFAALLVLAAAALLGGAGGKSEAPAEPAMALIPAGTYALGDGEDNDHPAHTVGLDAFWMDAHEVTNAEYLAFCRATERRLPIFWGMERFRCGEEWPEHPVVGVSLNDATAYAEWAGKRIPTEAEWEAAARGGLVGQSFATGEDVDSTTANCARFGYDATLPVGSFAPNGYGLYDMTGNVQEWTTDFYDPDYFLTELPRNPQGPNEGRFRVLRGGGWYAGKSCGRVFVRYALPSSWQDFNVGFRCVKDAAD